MSIFTVFNQKVRKPKYFSRNPLSNPLRFKLIPLKLVIDMNKCLLIKEIRDFLITRRSKPIKRRKSLRHHWS